MKWHKVSGAILVQSKRRSLPAPCNVHRISHSGLWRGSNHQSKSSQYKYRIPDTSLLSLTDNQHAGSSPDYLSIRHVELDAEPNVGSVSLIFWWVINLGRTPRIGLTFPGFTSHELLGQLGDGLYRHCFIQDTPSPNSELSQGN